MIANCDGQNGASNALQSNAWMQGDLKFSTCGPPTESLAQNRSAIPEDNKREVQIFNLVKAPLPGQQLSGTDSPLFLTTVARFLLIDRKVRGENSHW
jgi:hypothetical protein